jgi:para-aminobenzoate synthetase/4-amino-4-deoxychorismate lyase
VGSLVLLEDMLAGGEARSRRFLGPAGTARCGRPSELAGFFADIDSWRRSGLHVVLLLDYEFGELLEPTGSADGAAAAPPGACCAQALAFESVQRATTGEVGDWIARELSQRGPRAAPAGVAALEPDIDRLEYGRRFEQVQQFIRDGHTYQINLTFPLHLRWYGDPLALYRQLRARQKVSYAAFIEAADRTVVSLSPELFIRRSGDTIQTRPMKGTRPRGRDAAEDIRLAEEMRADPKSRAENLMIVDLLRNDLGRISEVGSVRVRSLFDVEVFETVLQMTSTVQGRIAPHLGLEQILRALFPCGSVTGAPKHRSRQIIAQLERRPRGIYTGSIGYLDPDGTLSLNVAIRTLELKPDGRGLLGIGGGVVADSTAQDEWNECFIKARFLTRTDPGFELIETMRADLLSEAAPSGATEGRPQPGPGSFIALWDEHMKRLRGSAGYFGFRFDPVELEQVLMQALAPLPAGAHRVRLLLNKDGEARVSAEPLPAASEAAAADLPAVRIADAIVRSDAWHQAHKTTCRPQYDEGLQQAGAEGLWDLLFCNERGELVEGARSSVFVRLDGRLATPPLTSGALPGVMRARVLADPTLGAVERTILRSELPRAQALYLCNAVRGWFPARLVQARQVQAKDEAS